MDDGFTLPDGAGGSIGFSYIRQEASIHRHTTHPGTWQTFAGGLSHSIAACLNDAAARADYQVVVGLPDDSRPNRKFERSVTVVVDGSAAWPLIATLRHAGRTPEQIIVDLQAWGFVRLRGAAWTPGAVEEILHRFQEPPELV